MDTMAIAKIAVLGAGTMGHGIAHAAIAGGYTTRMYDVSDAAVAKGRGAIEDIVKKGVELGKLSAGDAAAVWPGHPRSRESKRLTQGRGSN